MRPETISRYSIVRSLGAGGMGEVFLARDPELDRLIAVKVLRREVEGSDPTAPARLRDEARALAALNHPGIVTIHEIGNDGDRDFITMEFVEGRSLGELIAAGPLSIGRVREIALDVAAALKAAHSAGVLHRDIKPDNVMVEPHGPVRVVDFGIAHRLGTSEPGVATNAPLNHATLASTLPLDFRQAKVETNTLFGTPAYMAPEVINGYGATTSSDVYSFGVMLYETLAGQLPYSGPNLIATLARVIDPSHKHAPLRSTRPEVPGDLAELVDWAMAKAAGERPSMSQVLEALEASALAASQPIPPMAELAASTGSPAPTVPGPYVPAGRTRGLVVLALGVVAALAAAVALAVVLRSSESDGEQSPVDESSAKVIAISPIEGDFSSLGHSAPTGQTLAQVLGKLLGEVDGIEVTRDPRAAQDGVVQTRLSPQAGGSGFEVSVKLVGNDTKAVFEQSFESASEADGIFQSALLLAKQLAPRGDDVGFSAGAADVAFELGVANIANDDWSSAVNYLEQAVLAKPTFPSAWLYLALARGWVGAPAEATQAAAAKAESTAGTEPERKLGRAVRKYVNREWAASVALLAPLVKASPMDRDLLYLYGEALFHDGQIAAAIDQFERATEISPRFKPVRRHLREVAFARRSFGDLRRHHGSSTKAAEAAIAFLSRDTVLARSKGFSPRAVDFVEGHYERLDSLHRDKRDARSVAYRIARLVHKGQRSEAKALFRSEWPSLAREADTPRGAFGVQEVSRVALAAGLAEPTRALREWWRTHSAPINLEARAEVEIFSASLLGEAQPDPRLLKLSTRATMISDALRLASSGDRVAALEALGKIVAQPAGNARDTVLHAAYLDLLAAEGRRSEIETECANWTLPRSFVPVYLILRARCDSRPARALCSASHSRNVRGRGALNPSE